MAMRLLLIHPGFPYRGKDLFPLGLGYLAAISEDLTEIKVLDEADEEVTPEAIMDFGPDIVGITSTSPSFPRAAAIMGMVKSHAPGAKIVMGGTHATFLPDEALDAGADMVVRGEGETVFRRIIDGYDPARIDGISYRRDGETIHNMDYVPIENLDTIPFPAHRYFPLEKYGIMSVVTSRGCPYSCSYCCATRFWKKVRFRSPGNVIEELERIRNLRYRLVKFQDSTFTADKDRAKEICQGMKDTGLGFKWSCETRADHLTGDLLGVMGDAGCNLLCMGVDSGSQTVLDNIRRHMKVEIIENAFEMARDHGIRTRAYVTFGMPGETVETVEETLDLLERISPDQAILSLATSYPGTELWDAPRVDAPFQWVRTFGGHGDNSPLFLSDTLDSGEYMELAEVIRDGIKRILSG